jgi:hypothetical protein
MRCAVAVLGPAGQIRAFHRLPRAGALHRGGVNDSGGSLPRDAVAVTQAMPHGAAQARSAIHLDWVHDHCPAHGDVSSVGDRVPSEGTCELIGRSRSVRATA